MGSLENDTNIATTTAGNAVDTSVASGLLKKVVTKRTKKSKKPQKLQYLLQFETVPSSRHSTRFTNDTETDSERVENTEMDSELKHGKTETHTEEWSYESLLEEDQLDDEYSTAWVGSKNKTMRRVGSSVQGNATTRSIHSTKKPRVQKDKLMNLHDERKKLKRDETIKANYAHQKVNIESRLVKNGIKRFGLELYMKRSDCSPPSKPSAGKSHTNVNVYIRDDPVSVKRHELKKTNVPTEHAYLAQMIDLQHRELTPEDYELLLLLDNTVSAKTVDPEQIQSIREVSVTAAELVGEVCSICMENYEEEQKAKMLPCKHYFHSTCIDFWLTNSSYKCPLDGLEVFSE